ncbi:MAG: AAA family ATPase [Bacteroidetes bacterium]|nr:MAG: AAA family ATPase [Bacteroidota bacterium]
MLFRGKKSLEKKYKYKDLKVYASTEWLADGQKKYYTVFETSECSYLYAELSFYNKLFDQQDWEIKVNLKCFRLLGKSKREELCDINLNSKISKDDDIARIREGWGNKEPGFWTRGDYAWEAYLDEELVGTRNFYVEEGGVVTETSNPYFEIENINLYEGPNQGVPTQERHFYTHFKAKETRYIWAEFNFDNLQTSSWYCEIFFYFYNEAGQLKGRTVEMRKVEGDEEEVTFTTGWGSDTKGSWYGNKYNLHVVFMDKLIAIVPFSVGEEFVEGSAPVIKGNSITRPQAALQDNSKESLEELLEKINELIGLNQVKQQIYDYIDYVKFIQLRKNKGFEEKKKMNLHTVFRGNPGTGKTTVANLLGKIFHKIGALSSGKILEVGRAELIGQYIGQTAPRVKDVIERARGGVLFIDEAYALVRNKDDNKDYGQEVIEILIKEMSDGEGDIAIFMAGYTRGMDTMLDANPGLKSRFNLFLEFPDFLPQELFRVLELASDKNEVVLDEIATEFLKKKILQDYRAREENFGNARMVNTQIERAKVNLGVRVMKISDPENLDREMLQTVSLPDVQKIFAKPKPEIAEIDTDMELLEESLSELNAMVGLTLVKKQINDLVNLVKYFRESKKNVLGEFSLHTIFKGNPGTGKTTVARILSKIYQALGILERGHLVECDRQGLVAGFIGQTALKTKEKITQAQGGVLFIDEAYALNSVDGAHDFGREAIEVIIKEMEDKRKNFIVIAAGYPKNMDTFLEMNPGLKSRFDNILVFEDFSIAELYQIAVDMLAKENLSPDSKAERKLKEILKSLHSKRDKYFGNGRVIRKLISQAVTNQYLRMSNLKISQRTEQMIQTLTVEDLKDISGQDENLTGKGQIGFKR